MSSAETIRAARVRSFIQLAREELAVSADLMQAHRRQSAYFLQQAVEKALRGVLEVEGIAAGPMHSIRGLSDLLPKDHPMRERFIELEPLSSASTRYRYPTANGTLMDIGEKHLRELKLLADAVIAEAIVIMETYLEGPAKSGL